MSKAPVSDPRPDLPAGHRPVRSFVLRGGRMTKAQARALADHWPTYGLELEADAKLPEVLAPAGDLVLEIGFGNGEALVHMAGLDPNTTFVGVEVHRPGIGALMLGLAENELSNVRVLCADACQILTEHVLAGSLAGLRLYFPDPWPKKRHHKRRIVQAEFVDQVATALRPGGLFHLATDWQPYADHMLEVLNQCPSLANTCPPGAAPRPPWRPETRFERRGLRLGHQVSDFLFERRADD